MLFHAFIRQKIPPFESKMLLNCNTEVPKMANHLWTIDWHFIRQVRSFYALPVACNSQQVISQSHLNQRLDDDVARLYNLNGL